MSLSIARPYAKAVFFYAKEKNLLQPWLFFLQQLANIVELAEVKKIVLNPLYKKKIHAFIWSLLKTPPFQSDRFLTLLILRSRLFFVPEMVELFMHYLAEYEDTISVEIKSASEMTPTQKADLIRWLQKKFKKVNVQAYFLIDTTLLAGFCIKMGDSLIDKSVRGMLQQYNNVLIKR